MVEPPPEPLMTWRFIRQNAVQFMIGALLVAAVSTAVFVGMPYQREQRIAGEMQAVGGRVEFRDSEPNWIPHSIQERVPFLKRAWPRGTGSTFT